MKSSFFIALGLVAIINNTSRAEAATTEHEYVIDIQPSDIERTDSTRSAVFKRGIDSPLVEVQTGDTFSGTIRFSGITQFYANENFGITAGFFFGGSRNVSYRDMVLTNLIDAKGNILTSDLSYFSEGNSGYHSFSTGDFRYSDFKIPIAGMKFNIQFLYIKDNYSNNPVKLQLGNLTIGSIRSVASAVPEPSTWAMMMLGLTGIGLAMRRRPAMGIAAIT